jgi:uncharacterized protein YndB with AHSA1/START domain
MNKLHFETKINAPKEKVWAILWNDESYRKWTNVFSEGSHAVSNWNEGDEIKFLGPTGDGMFSVIDRKIPNEFISFKHLGVIKDGKEQPADPATETWSGSKENYTLKGANGETELSVDIDVTDEFEGYFKDTFPKALDKVKELSEN